MKRTALPVLTWIVLASASVAHAETQSPKIPVRTERRLLVGVSLANPWVFGHDVSIPVPSLRVGVNILPRLMVDLTAGTLPFDSAGRLTLVDLGMRWHLTESAVSPYVMAHVGDFIVKATEGAANDRTYPYAAVGGGLEYACRCGFAVWAEAAPALVSYTGGGPRSTELGLFTSLGLGYRVRTAR